MKFLSSKSLVILLVLAVISASFSSCVVSKKKFDELLSEKVKQDADLQALQADVEELTAKLEDLEQRFAETSTERDELSTSLDDKTAALDKLQAEHDQLQTYYNNALSNSGKLNRDLAEQQERLMALEATLKQQQYDADLLADSLAQREARVAELEKIVADGQRATEDLKNKVKAALTNFGASDLTVEERNGRVYVSLSEKLLFSSGSIKVDENGVKALQQLAEALKSSPEIRVNVEGHTDNVPISKPSKYMKDNWDLSVMRATSIVRILTNAGVDPDMLMASGRGEHSPVAANDTAGNKALNRRTEIILTPDLTALMEALGYQ